MRPARRRNNDVIIKSVHASEVLVKAQSSIVGPCLTVMKCEPSELVDTTRSVVAPLGRGPGTTDTFCSIIEPAPLFSRIPMPGEARSFRSMKLVAALSSTTIAWALPLAIVTGSPTATGSWLGKQSFAPQRK